MELAWLIDSRNDLADYLEISRSTLTYVLYAAGTDSFYRSFDIPKKDGSMRHINAPTGVLKDIQSRLADKFYIYQKRIWGRQGVRAQVSHAFEKEKSIITNAKIHRNKRYVLNLDLKDFFDSFHFGRVAGYFEKNRYFQLPREVAIVIAQLTCYKGRLPQGAPSSPIITNLIAQVLDQRLLKLARAHHLDYTRYADDLTFSTNDRKFLSQYSEFLEKVRKEIEKCGFAINDKKTRLQYYGSRQEVTGLVVNRRLSIKREYWRDTRAMAHSLYTTGAFQINGLPGTLNQLEGRFTFIDQLDKYENKKCLKPQKSGKLSGREKQYQAFLVYKYFYASEYPLIVTEGKTDVAYIKAALKNLHEDYPDLIEQKTEGGFNFKLRFLKRSSKLEYFLKLGQYGADAINHLYDCFMQQPALKVNENEALSRKPTLLIFDHELKTDRPLKKFVSHVKLPEEEKQKLEDACYVALPKTESWFLVTNPLVGGKTECEIEDLFDKSVLEHSFDGKTFSRKAGDSATTVSKEIFSRYISEEWASINFERFRPLLDAINSVVQLHTGVLTEAAAK